VFSFYAFSQPLSISIGSGVSILQGNNYYTSDFSAYRPGIYIKNGATSPFPSMSLNDELALFVGIKLNIFKTQFSVNADVNYIPMRGKHKVTSYDSYMMRETHPNAIMKLDIWSFGVGGRYDYPIGNFIPYVSASVLMNYFNDSRVEFDEDEVTTEYPFVKNGMRYGYRFGVGVGYAVLSDVSLEIGVTYNLMNEYNTRALEEKMNTVNLLFAVNYNVLP
jgi:opacity protein-like surface antigen